MSTKAPAFTRKVSGPDTRIAVVAARFNADVVNDLLRGCVNRLKELGVVKPNISIYRVPGAFELPVTAKVAAQTRKFSAVICLGAVIRGETPHFEYVAGTCATGIARVALEEQLPVIFGVLTTNNHDQAWARSGGKHGNAGARSAEAAIEMIATLAAIRDKA